MQDHATDPGVYIRSMSSRGHLGGLAAATPAAVRVLAGAGCDVVLVETVGVGQAEVEIASLADTTLVLLAPGMGDAIQAVKAGILSHGQKQWLEIGMLLMQDPRLLLVDEPVAGMTPQEVERTAELLLSLAGKHSVVVVEHDMEFVRSIARTVTVLHEGSVLAEGSMDAVQNDPKVIEVYLGESQAENKGAH
jgi:ABC-type uncharacterized transport system ATPase subunit